jgi:hypothetical protein
VCSCELTWWSGCRVPRAPSLLAMTVGGDVHPSAMRSKAGGFWRKGGVAGDDAGGSAAGLSVVDVRDPRVGKEAHST